MKNSFERVLEIRARHEGSWLEIRERLDGFILDVCYCSGMHSKPVHIHDGYLTIFPYFFLLIAYEEEVPIGVIGLQGLQGFTGAIGVVGPTGFTGPTGVVGFGEPFPAGDWLVVDNEEPFEESTNKPSHPDSWFHRGVGFGFFNRLRNLTRLFLV